MIRPSRMKKSELLEQYFNPRVYLNENFLSPDDEDLFAIQSLLNLKRKLNNDLFMLELGGGPSLYAIAPLVSKAREIHFCDLVEANLNEIKKWVKAEEDAFDWDEYFRMVLKEEGVEKTPERLADMKEEIRGKITDIFVCDALRMNDHKFSSKYDLITAHHCTDVAASTVVEWKEIIINIPQLLNSGGWFVVSITTGADMYTFGEYKVPCVSLSRGDVFEGFEEAGFDMTSFYAATSPVRNQEYSGIIIASAHL